MVSPSFKPFLWSYNCDSLDAATHAPTIIRAIVLFGSMQATRDLLNLYPKEKIQEVVSAIEVSDYTKKSLAFWNVILS